MALIIGVHKGKQVMVGKDVLTVGNIDQQNLEVEVEVQGKKFLLTEREQIELLPNVFAFAASSKDRDLKGYGRIAFQAPRSIRIERIPGSAAA